MKKYLHLPKQKYFSEKNSTLHVFANLFNFWLSRRQLDSHIGFCIQTIALPHRM